MLAAGEAPKLVHKAHITRQTELSTSPPSIATASEDQRRRDSFVVYTVWTAKHAAFSGKGPPQLSRVPKACGLRMHVQQGEADTCSGEQRLWGDSEPRAHTVIPTLVRIT